MMRSAPLITALALAAGLTATPAAASVAASNCRVELYDIDNHDVDERDGKDELRFLVGGNLFPPNGYVNVRNGDDRDPADFGFPSTSVSNTGSATFDLREVTPPAVGRGDSLGTVVVWGSTVCAPLATGAVDYVEDFVEGDDETFYSYQVKLKVTGL